MILLNFLYVRLYKKRYNYSEKTKKKSVNSLQQTLNSLIRLAFMIIFTRGFIHGIVGFFVFELR